MQQILKDRGSVFCDTDAWKILQLKIQEIKPSSIFVLTDKNTSAHCYPLLLQKVDFDNAPTLLSIASGEANKTIQTCTSLWQQLSNLGADRKSLLINLGGGVVTDLGGFVACTYQRGIEFINIPTSLLAMVDASVGGKNGLDLGVLKNQVGVIKNPLLVIIDPLFLQTLPEMQFQSGVAEMLKHGLIHDVNYLNQVTMLSSVEDTNLSNLIWESVLIKNEVVTEDPFEHGRRATLNFGHTLGHAIESYFLQNEKRDILLHGEAIAVGMVLTCYISSKLLGLSTDITEQIKLEVSKRYTPVAFDQEEITRIIDLLKHDKKNRNGKVLFVLLKDIGDYKTGCEVPSELIQEAFSYYL